MHGHRGLHVGHLGVSRCSMSGWDAPLASMWGISVFPGAACPGGMPLWAPRGASRCFPVWHVRVGCPSGLHAGHLSVSQCSMSGWDAPLGSSGGKCFTRLSSLHLNHYQVLSVGLTKKFAWAFLLNVTEKPKQTFWPTQYYCHPILQRGKQMQKD